MASDCNFQQVDQSSSKHNLRLELNKFNVFFALTGEQYLQDKNRYNNFLEITVKLHASGSYSWNGENSRKLNIQF
jgi:hypothetical protein